MEVNPVGTLLLTRDDLRALLTPDDYLQAVAEAFSAHAENRVLKPALMHVDAPLGEFHIKGGGLKLEHDYFALKVNGGFFGNAERNGLPPIQGVILLFSADHGYPLAVMDSTAITIARTAATTALAARHLAREDSSIVAICGCGNQGAAHLRYIMMVRPITKAYAWDINNQRAQAFARRMSSELGIEIVAAETVADATANCDICITCTPSREPFLLPEHVNAGMFIAAVGADSPLKQELDPRILSDSKVVVDIIEQSAAVGELHHALVAGLMTVNDVHAQLGEIVTGSKCGRTNDAEVTVFDATGTALQDAAAATVAFTKATANGTGKLFDFFSRPD